MAAEASSMAASTEGLAGTLGISTSASALARVPVPIVMQFDAIWNQELEGWQADVFPFPLADAQFAVLLLCDLNDGGAKL